MEPIFSSKDIKFWQEKLSKAGVPCAPVQTLDQVVKHEQVAALGIVEKSDTDGIPMVGLPLNFDNQRPPPASNAPKLGSYNNIFDSFKEKDKT